MSNGPTNPQIDFSSALSSNKQTGFDAYTGNPNLTLIPSMPDWNPGPYSEDDSYFADPKKDPEKEKRIEKLKSQITELPSKKQFVPPTDEDLEYSLGYWNNALRWSIGAYDGPGGRMMKDAYNRSIPGIAESILYGEQPFDLPLGDEGMMYNLGVGIGAFLMPSRENVALTAGSLGIGKFAKTGINIGGRNLGLGSVNNYIAKQLVKKGVMPKRAIKPFVNDMNRILGYEGITFANLDMLYGSTLNLRDAVIAGDYYLDKFDGLSEMERYNLFAKDLVNYADPKDWLKGYSIAIGGATGFGMNRYTKGGLLGPIMPKSRKIQVETGFRPRGVTTKGVEFGIAGEIAGGITTAAFVEPEMRKVISDIENGEIGLAGLMTSVVMASYVPSSLRNAYKTGKFAPGVDTRSMSLEEFADATEEAVSLAGSRKRSKDIYTRVQDPLIKVENTQPPTSKPIFETDADGNMQLVGYDTEQSDMAIKRLNSRQLPQGMATGPYMNVNIKGKVVRADGSIEPTLHEIPKDLDVKIDRNSLKVTDTGISFEVKAGRLRYQLDEDNADLFFKFYTSQPGLKKRFEANNKGVFNQKFAMTRIRRKALEGLRDDSYSGKNGLKKGDYDRAIANVGAEYDIKKFQNPNKLPDINDMSDIEMRLVTEQFGDMALLRNHEEYIRKEFFGELENISGTSGASIAENFARSLFAGFQSSLQSPQAKTLTRMFAQLDRNITSTATDRVVDFQKAVGMDTSVISLRKAVLPVSRIFGYNPFQSRLTERWLVGQTDEIVLQNGTKIPSAWKTYQKLQGGEQIGVDYLDEMIKENKRLIRRADRKGGMDQLTPEERFFLNNRVKIIKNLKRVNDPIYEDALGTKMKLAGRQKYYLPSVIKKPIRDAIYSNMLNINQKMKVIMKELDNLSLDSDVALRNLDETKKAELTEYLEDYVRKLAASKDETERAFADIWTMTRDALEAKPGSLSDVPNYDVWANIQAQIYNDGFKTYAPLQKSKKLLGKGKSVDIMALAEQKKTNLLDKNVVTLETDYINGATKAIELNKMFMPEGALFETLVNQIDDSIELQGAGSFIGRVIKGNSPDKLPPFIVKEKDAVRLLKETITGEDAFTRFNSFTAGALKAAEIEFFFKINFGTAVIPNLTQTFISTLPQLGAASTVRGLVNYWTNPQVRDMVKRSGATALNLYDELLGGSRALQRGQSRATGGLTESYAREVWGANDYWQVAQDVASKPFMTVNVWNKIVAASAAEDNIIKLTKMLDGKPGFDIGMPTVLTGAQRKSYATNKLKQVFNLNPKELEKFKDSVINRTYTTKAQLRQKKKIMGAMERYAQQSQMGRDFELDALGFTDQYTKTLLLFKRFPIRQTRYTFEYNKFEIENGNILQPLYTLAYGAAGGTMAISAKDAFLQALSGDRAFYGQREQKNYIDKINKQFFQGQKGQLDLEDGLNILAGAGTLGSFGDIISNMDRFYSSVEFAVKPLIVDDIVKLTRNIFGDEGDEGLVEGLFFQGSEPIDIRMRKLLRENGPIFGSMPNAFFKRYHYSPLIVPFTDIEIAQYPEGFEKDKVSSMKSNIISEVNNMLLFTYNENGDPEIGYMPDKLDNYDEVMADAREKIKTWNESIYVRRFPSAQIVPDDYSQEKVMEYYARFVNRHKKYYEADVKDEFGFVDDDGVTIIPGRDKMAFGKLREDFPSEEAYQKALERQEKIKEKRLKQQEEYRAEGADRPLKGLLKRN